MRLTHLILMCISSSFNCRCNIHFLFYFFLLLWNFLCHTGMLAGIFIVNYIQLINSINQGNLLTTFYNNMYYAIIAKMKTFTCTAVNNKDNNIAYNISPRRFLRSFIQPESSRKRDKSRLSKCRQPLRFPNQQLIMTRDATILYNSEHIYEWTIVDI